METTGVSWRKRGEEREQCALIKMIKGLTELCLDVFIQLISKVADDCLTFIAINFTVFVHLDSVILHLLSLSIVW